MDQTIKIIAEPQKEADKCKFILEKPFVEGGYFEFLNAEAAKGSTLAEEIFKVKNVASIQMTSSTIIVTKSEDSDWREIGKNIGQAIRIALTSGKTLISEEFRKNLPSDKDLKQKVQKILDEKVNPAVAAHGGVIEILDVKHSDLFIKMGGGCHGCAMSTATLKQGVEKALREEIPYLGAIYDTTDHAAGANPFYQPG